LFNQKIFRTIIQNKGEESNIETVFGKRQKEYMFKYETIDLAICLGTGRKQSW
jgi:hypothetical protein